MRLQFHLPSLIAFLILVLLLHEAHESAHYFTAWLVCGCPGSRDFLVWKLCSSCTDQRLFIIASFAGPLVTYAFMWVGLYLLRKRNTVRQKTIGFALVLGALPLPRWLAGIDKGGDEISTLRRVFTGPQTYQAVLLGGFIVLLFTIPPVWRAFKTLRNKQRILILLAFLAIPWILDRLIVEKLLNGNLAANGVLMSPVYGGIPLLVLLWQGFLLVAFAVTARHLKYLSRDVI
ncbi:MAG: hypothetical protein EOP49_36820 [Sphingobacteriales bacterium]|nr:MAG: hypothetical protein EOP49_36820 [Sphingobacteriales bacterium]